jgi:hypothetical protein
MKRLVSAAFLIALVGCCWSSLAAAQTKGATRQPSNPAALQCAKENGAGYDPVTKQWTMYGTERDMMGRIDAYRACVARRTGVPQRAVPVRERMVNTPG